MIHCIYLGVSGYNLKKKCFFFGLNIFYTLTQSVDPDEMPHTVHHLGRDARKSVVGVSNEVRFKPACSATETS